MPQTNDSAQTGGIALDEVAANFARIGWGPARNSEPYDLGTDLWVQVRDRNGVDRGILVGAQVKGGSSYFGEVVRDDSGALNGWYYRDDTARFEHWSAHAVPHLLVLHDLGTRVSYWVHITPDVVESTGVQCKVLVPADQTISDESFDRLIDVAVSQRAAAMLGGSAWKASAAAIPPHRRWRHALLVPRVVAPHQNRGLQVELRPEEAAALVVSGRQRDWELIAEHTEGVPSLEQAVSHEDWDWRFAASIDTALSGDLEPLRGLHPTAPASAQRTAATIILACQLAARDGQEAALATLNATSGTKDLTPVDQAWLLVQVARFRAEIGEIEQAAHDAVVALQGLVGDEHDATAAALIASASQMVWTLSAWTDQSLEELVTRGDTPAIWWRSQERGAAFAEYFKTSFSNWSRSGGFSFAVVDQEVRGLLSAATTADLAGDHGAWRSDVTALGRLLAMRAHAAGDIEKLTAALDLLRRVGDEDGVQAMLRKVGETGPLEIVHRVTEGTAARWWTRTSSRANLQLWRSGADLLDSQTLADAIDFCIGALSEPNHTLITRARPRFQIHAAVLPTLASLLRYADAASHRRVERLSRDLFADNVGVALVRHELRGVVHGLDWKHVSDDARVEWFDLVQAGPRDELAGIVVGSLADAGLKSAQEELVTRAAAGDWQSLARLKQPDVLGPDAVDRITDLLQTRIDEMVDRAEHHSWGMGMTIDIGALAVHLTTAVPGIDLWAAIVRLVTCPVATAEQKAGACLALALEIDAVPDVVRRQLIEKIDDVALAARAFLSADDAGSLAIAATRLRLALHLLGDQAITREIVTLLASIEPDHRRQAAALIGLRDPADLRVALPALLGDSANEVRCEAAFAIGALAGVDPPDPFASALTLALCSAPGRLLPLAVLGGLARGEGELLQRDLIGAVEGLLQHPSALVRKRAKDLLSRSDSS